MPFAEVSAFVADVGEDFGKRCFIEAEPAGVGVGDADPVGVSSGEAAGAGRGADGGGGVETIEAQAVGGHGVHGWRADPALVGMRRTVRVGDGYAVVAGVSPAHVVRHGEDDVGARGGEGEGSAKDDQSEGEELSHEVRCSEGLSRGDEGVDGLRPSKQLARVGEQTAEAE